MNLAFLASNNGTSFRAIVAAIRAGRLDATPVLAVSNRSNAGALDFAQEQGIAARRIATLPDPDIADARLLEALSASGADLVILSGYLRKLGPRVLERFAGRILNVHPALLPRHGGQGMYGRRVHEAVIAGGDRTTGASVHLVDQDYDHGPVLARLEIPVARDDTPEVLEAKVMAAEPELFIEVLKAIADGGFPDLALGDGGLRRRP
jgi:phosphoribosylglycinamide formyltransferase-1